MKLEIANRKKLFRLKTRRWGKFSMDILKVLSLKWLQAKSISLEDRRWGKSLMNIF
jgi:hypothetical protein